MSNPFSPPTIPGSYNLSPPSDDGSQVTSNQISWNGNNGTAGVKLKLTDPLVTWINNLITSLTSAFSQVISGPATTVAGDIALWNSSSGAALSDSGFTLGAALRSYLAGLTMSTAGGSGTMSIAAGTSMSDDQTTLMASAASSKTTASWAVGAGNGGLDTGAIAANTWYHFFQIKRTDTGVTDFIFSLQTGTANGGSNPTLPANYTKLRYIGSGLTDGSAHWLAFTQVGDWFLWKTSSLDVNAVTTLANTAAFFTLTNGVPPGFNVLARVLCSGVNSGAGTFYWFYTPLMNDEAAAASEANVVAGGAGTNAAAQIEIFTDATQRIKGVSNQAANNTNSIRTIGYMNYRGRFA